jgi:hypothetical protein
MYSGVDNYCLGSFSFAIIPIRNPVTNRVRYCSCISGNLKIFDVLGRQIQTLVNEMQAPGQYTVTFNASDLSSGIYFYRIEAGDFVAVKKLMLMK